MKMKETDDNLHLEKEHMDQKVKEQALELPQSENRYHSLFNFSPFPIIIHDGKKIIDANPALINALQLKNKNDIIGLSPDIFVHTDDFQKSQDRQALMLKENKPLDAEEYRLIMPWKEERIALAYPTPITFGNEKFFMITYQDITQRKKTEEKLIKSEKRFKKLFNDLGDAVFVTKFGGQNKGKIIEVNSSAEIQTGYSRAELLKMNIIDDLVVAGFQEIPTDDSEVKLSEGKTLRLSEKKRKKDGTEYWTDVIITRIEFDEQEATLSINHDITIRKRDEQVKSVIYNISNAVTTTNNLKELIIQIQKELSTVIDTTNFYLATYDEQSDTISLPYFVDENDDFKSIPAERTITRYVIQTQKSLLADLNKIHQLEQEGEIGRFGSDSLIWLGVPLKIDGKVTGVLAVQSYTNENAYNESDQKMLEFVSNQIGISINRKKTEGDLMIALKKATESDRLKSAFLANMSHEIRTPMNGILGFAGLLKEAGHSGEQQTEYIEVIEKSGNRMLNIINQIIDISKIESGLMKVFLSKSNVNEQIEYVYNFFKPEVEEKGMKLFSKSPLPIQDAFYITDSEKTIAILVNLVKNAIKYSKKGSIEFGYEIVVDKTHENYLQFYVKDTGLGIAKDRHLAIFERFIQADIEDRNAYQGAGLGLAISKAYVEMLGGKIWVESALGVGSTFFFTIPFTLGDSDKLTSAESEKSEEKIEIAKKSDKTLKILIADDDELSDAYLSIILKKIGAELYHANNGVDAVATFFKNPDIDIILMDMKMPLMSGYEATRLIKEKNKNVFIIAQTAYALMGDNIKTLQAGCDEYISKPIIAENLLKIIEDYINR
ncbi:MAG: hypothetical protein AUJ98_09000 [Bacteroidetes bacterium CG2_30_33_31]|nr:MAG: hypothetical protein AUJ98_09000 [Bacteroidetes bacterium CG2_30_33_31]